MRRLPDEEGAAKHAGAGESFLRKVGGEGGEVDGAGRLVAEGGQGLRGRRRRHLRGRRHLLGRGRGRGQRLDVALVAVGPAQHARWRVPTRARYRRGSRMRPAFPARTLPRLRRHTHIPRT
jgi:hypothetical protein